MKHIVLVLSGKGGVGKSTLSTQIAVALRDAGKRVGILDIDLCGPSIPKMFGVSKNEIHVCDEGCVSVQVLVCGVSNDGATVLCWYRRGV